MKLKVLIGGLLAALLIVAAGCSSTGTANKTTTTNTSTTTTTSNTANRSTPTNTSTTNTANTANTAASNTSAPSSAAEGGKQDFTLHNQTGVEIHSLYVSPHDLVDWGEASLCPAP